MQRKISASWLAIAFVSMGAGCASRPPASETREPAALQPTAAAPMPDLGVPVVDPVAGGPTAARKMPSSGMTEADRARLTAEIGALDGQIAGLEGVIADAQARLMHYESMNIEGKEGLVAGPRSEILMYESQKYSLHARRTELLQLLSVLR